MTSGSGLVGGASSQTGGITSTTAEAQKQPDAFLRENEGAEGTNLTSKVNENLIKEKGNLDTQYGDYTKKVEGSRVQKLGDNDIRGAVKGSENEFQKVSNLLGSQYQGPGQFDYRAPTDVKDLSYLTQGVKGTEALLKQQNGPGYTSGMARLDARLQQNNPMYQQSMQEALKNREVLDTTAAQDKVAANQALQQTANEYDQYKDSVRGNLMGLGKGIDSNINERLRAEKAKRDQMVQYLNTMKLSPEQRTKLNLSNISRPSEFAEIESQFGNILNQARNGHSYADYYDSRQDNPYNYIKVNNNVDYSDVADPEQISDFNNINKLLGGTLGGPKITNNSKGKAFEFDADTAGWNAQQGYDKAQRYEEDQDAAMNRELDKIKQDAFNQATGMYHVGDVYDTNASQNGRVSRADWEASNKANQAKRDEYVKQKLAELGSPIQQRYADARAKRLRRG